MNNNVIRVKQIEDWFLHDYILRLLHIKRCKYLGITPDETEYALQKEAYLLEQEYRALKGKKPLDDLKNIINL